MAEECQQRSLPPRAGRRVSTACQTPFDERAFLNIVGASVLAATGELSPGQAMALAHKRFQDAFGFHFCASVIRSFPAARGNQPATLPFREPRYPSHSPASLSLRWTVGAERHLHYTFQFIQNQQALLSGFLCSSVYFLNANQNFSFLLFLVVPRFCIIATFFFHLKNMFELERTPAVRQRRCSGSRRSLI